MLQFMMECTGLFECSSRVTYLFLLLMLCAFSSADICPRGYWAAEIEATPKQKGINQYSTDRKFGLPYGPIGNKPICRFCPKISCFIMRIESEKKDAKKLPPVRRRPRLQAGQVTTTTPKTGSVDNLFTVSGNTTATKAPEIVEEANILMSCAPNADLPHASQIITYLDCVQIGQQDLYYLFIYTPVNKENEVVPVDCIDPNFLTWIPQREKLKGIELGFPMKRLPPMFFRYYRHLMQDTEQVCIDSSALTNNEIDPNDLQRFDSQILRQTVYRHLGLKRDLLPPKQPNNTAVTGHSSLEVVDECPNSDEAGFSRTYVDRDCRYSAAVMPINETVLVKKEVEKSCACTQCTHVKPVIQVSSRERKKLPAPKYVITLLNMALLALVIILIFGTVLGFCIHHKDNAQILFLTRARKRKREMEEALMREAAERAAKEAEEANLVNWNPFLNRYGGMLAAGGAIGGFGHFSARLPTGGGDEMGNANATAAASSHQDGQKGGRKKGGGGR